MNNQKINQIMDDYGQTELDKHGISVIMPVYNTPKLVLEESLNSILSQTFENFEIICVNDGSTDETTCNVLEEYNNNTERVQLINLDKSVGCGGARNVGLKRVRGKYTIFLDSDDYFAPNYLQDLYDCIEKDKTDVCVTGFSIFNEKNNEKVVTSKHGVKRTYNSYVTEEDLLLEATLSACNKLVRTEYIKSNDIKFKTTETDDDVLYGAMVLLCTNNISFLDDSDGFLYRFDTDYQLSSNMNPLDLLAGIIQVEKELKNKNIDSEDIKKNITRYFIEIGLMEMSRCNQDNVNESFYEKAANYLKGKGVTLKSETYEMYRKKWISLSYESKWFEKIGNYEMQLRDNRDELLKQVKSLDKPIVVWGMGKRGRAFIKFAFENEIDICAICDKQNSECGSYDEYQNKIISTSEVLDMKNIVIVATTNQIFSDIKSVAKVTVIPLQIYCEL